MVFTHKLIQTNKGEIVGAISHDIQFAEGNIKIDGKNYAPSAIKVDFPVGSDSRKVAISAHDTDAAVYREVAVLHMKHAGDVLASKALLAVPEVRTQFGDAIKVWERRIAEMNPVEIQHPGRDSVRALTSQSEYMERFDR